MTKKRRIPFGTEIIIFGFFLSLYLLIFRGEYYSMDEMATKMWRLLQEELSKEAVVARIVAEYDIGEDRVEHDLTHFIEDLQANGLIEESAEGSS